MARLLGLAFPLIYTVMAALAGAEAITRFKGGESLVALGFLVVMAVALRLLYASVVRWRANAERWKDRNIVPDWRNGGPGDE